MTLTRAEDRDHLRAEAHVSGADAKHGDAMSDIARARGTMVPEHDVIRKKAVVDRDEDRWAGKRADARRNHDRVLAAAVEVFTEHGLDATIPQVAARAGVGKATVYRSYPTKADLVRALTQVHLDWLSELTKKTALTAEDDAVSAITAMVEAIFVRLAEDRLMVAVLSGVEGLEDDPARVVAAERIIALGREQEALRADATGMDIQVLVSGCARVLLDMGVRDPQLWRRYAELSVAALRP